ncbi:hypothetical protein BC831DRAFT_386456, partial [Entophlyctis helioformis]
LSRNKIERFPNSLGNLMALRVLSISKNRIQFLPKYIAAMARLQVLKLDHNPFVWPPARMLQCESEDMEKAWLIDLKAFL